MQDLPASERFFAGGGLTVRGFSLDRLVRLLVLLGSDVEIVVKPRARTAGRARVLVA